MKKPNTASQNKQTKEKVIQTVDSRRKQTDQIYQELNQVISIQFFLLLQECQEGNDKENQIVTACAASDQQREIGDEKQNLRILKWNNRFPVSANHECDQ